MASVNYTAQESLIGGHSAGTAYDLNLRLMAPGGMDRSRNVTSHTSVSLTGATQTIYHRGDTLWSVKTIPVTGAAVDAMREFLDSVQNGQAFLFDPRYDAGASPGARRSVVIASNGYKETRPAARGDGGDNDYFVFSWQMRELP